MWKGFTCWKVNVRFTKNKGSKLEVGKVLFTNNEIIQKGILDVRELCEKASSSLTGIGTGDDAISLLCVQPGLTYTLEEFCKTQEEHMDKAREKIFALRKKVVEIVKQVCEVSNKQTNPIFIFAFFNLENMLVRNENIPDFIFF